MSTETELVRLNKYLAEHGIASRRRCDELIAKGKVFVDGELTTVLGTKIDPARQAVEVDGVPLKPENVRHRYYLLNKPAGVVCTNEERESRTRAVDLVTARDKGRIYTVGRLDEETIGIVLLTSDGEFANKVMHPRYGVPKTYLVKIAGRIDDVALKKIREGIHLSEGRTGGARVLVQKRSARLSTLVVTLREGKNREVRRVFASLGHKVKSLRRTRIGPIDDRRLKVGHWRPLTRAEVNQLVEFADATPNEKRALEGPRSRGTRHRRPGSTHGDRRGGPIRRRRP